MNCSLKKEKLTPDAVLLSHRVISLRFSRNWLRFLNKKAKYVLTFKTDKNETYKIYNPKKALVSEIFHKCFYVSSNEKEYLRRAFKDITKILKNGQHLLFFDIWTSRGKAKYIRVSNTAFTSPDMINFAKSSKKEWISIKKGKPQISFIEMAKES